MKQNDLRVGNWVFYECTVDDHEPKQVNGSDIALFTEWADRYSGIRLTEEWILKFGFEKQEYDDVDYIVYEHLDTVDRIKYYDHSEEFHWQSNDGFDEVQLFYVHELQNLFFAHHKEELTAK